MAQPIFNEEAFEAQIATLARLSDDVLIGGPTGSGKTHSAKAIHAGSALCGRPLVHLNCAAFSQDLLESELFGSVPGAFTNATRRPGLVGEAHEGTLFLDEIGDMSLAHQAKLFVVLDTRRYRQVGSATVEKAEFRLLSATSKDLVEECRQGRFRWELYYRINVLRLEVPPLGARRELALRVAEEEARDAKGGDPRWIQRVLAAVERLGELPRAWPGGVRELRNFVRKCTQGDPDEAARQLADEWPRMAPPLGGPLTRLPRAACPPLDDKSRYAGLIQRSLGGAPGTRPIAAASRDGALRLASRLLDFEGATLSRGELRDLLEVNHAATLRANLDRLLAAGLVRQTGDGIVSCWPPAESTLLIQQGASWVPVLAAGPAYAKTGDRLRIEVRSKLDAEVGVMLVTHHSDGARSVSTIAVDERVIDEKVAVEWILDDKTGFEQILVHLAPTQTRGGTAVEPSSRELVMPSAAELEEGRRLALARFGEGWLGEHFLYHGSAS